MPRNSENPALKRFTVFTAVSTLLLLCIGGLVTSHGAGLAVPDWPNTYGYNMFFFPVSQWVGGIFYEHSHRLVGSAVGFFVLILTFWVYGKKSRAFIRWGGVINLLLGLIVCWKYPQQLQNGIFLLGLGIFSILASFVWPRGEMEDKRLRRLALLALFTVTIQGILGGIRVTEMKDELGIFHGTLAQMFFVLICAMALIQTRFWKRLEKSHQMDTSGLRSIYILTTIVVLLQLALGATMRHQHAGLAIPDFPLAYGAVWPDTSEEAVASYNSRRLEVRDYNSITPFQIKLQMVHRIVAAVIVVLIALSFWLTKRRLGGRHSLTRFAAFWMFLVVVQFFLGAATIWTSKSADIATAHVAVGALTLVTGALMSMVAFKVLHSNSAVESSIPRFAPVAAK
ncbi:MAG: COX15/CtaA family protein [Verrucomicrobia bacterium]|nr:COX15/CtaA family protein [Verrucomicrobiota bacterium]